MPFYIRKSKKLGLLKINFSKSGIGASIGVKGARVAIGPRGSRINMGRGGIYYRKSLNTLTEHQPQNRQPLEVQAPASLPEAILTAEVEELVDTSSEEVLTEINTPRGNWFLRLFGFSKPLSMRYEFEGEAEKVYAGIRGAIQALSEARRLWMIETEQRSDRKYNAGANTLVGRRVIKAGLTKPPKIETNVEIWGIDTGGQELLFFPDRLLIYQRGRYGAVSYPELKLTVGQSQFREGGPMPSDGQVIGHSWKYVNKSGGPDRRFKDNRQIPILLYGEIHFQSDAGLNVFLHVSNKPAADRCCNMLAVAIKAMQFASLAMGPGGME